MGNSNCFVASCLWISVHTVFVETTSQSLDNAFILNAAGNIIQHFSDSFNSSYIDHEFDKFLDSVTQQTNRFMGIESAACQENKKNCTAELQCPSTVHIFQRFSNNSRLTANGFMEALPSILKTMGSDYCTDKVNVEEYRGRSNRKPTVGEAWGYSIGFATLVIGISNIGACLGPAMNKRFFRRMLQFLVAMGAGSLISTSLLVLIPEAFDIVAFEELKEYVWRATVVVISIYVFFCLERIMKTFMYKRQKIKRNISIIVEEPENAGVDDTSLTPLSKVAEDSPGHSHGPPSTDQAARQTLAWMVMAGDIIHNFVDGLSIGAAFSEDAALGVSVSLAVVCEELPHELADIAILLHSGMSMKKALFINFLSACTCYLGLCLGVTLGNMSNEASKWIFAMAGGLFLYVPLVDMLPDMSSNVDALLMSGNQEARVVVLLHALGLTIGAVVVVFIVNISPYIVIN